MTFWPKVLVNKDTISTLDDSLKLTLLENRKVFSLETATSQKLFSVSFALENLTFLKLPLLMLLNRTILPATRNDKQDLMAAILNLDILLKRNDVHQTADAMYFITRENLEIVLNDGSCLQIDSDFEFLKWHREEEYVYCIKALPWTCHGVEIKNIISKGLDIYIAYSKVLKSLNASLQQKKEISLKSGIQKEIVIQDLATFTLYLDSRITVMFDDRTIVKTDMSGSRFNVLCKDGDEIVLGNMSVGFQGYISLVKQFIEWNRNGCPVSQSLDVMTRLNKSKEFLKRIS
jgi:hypothetical protein